MAVRYNRSNVIRGQAAMWLRPYDPTAVLPSNQLALDGDWAVPATGNALWTPAGATEAGVTIHFTRSTVDITVEEQINPVDVATTTLNPRVEAILSEDTLETMTYSYGGGSISTVAPASGTVGYRELTISDELQHFTLGLEGINSNKFWRRVMFLDVLNVMDVTTVYRRAAKQRLYSVSFRMVSPLGGMKIREMNLAALP